MREDAGITLFMRFSNKLIERLRNVGFYKSSSNIHYSMQGRRLFRTEQTYVYTPGAYKKPSGYESLYKKSFVGKTDSRKTYSNPRVKLRKTKNKDRDTSRWWRLPEPTEEELRQLRAITTHQTEDRVQEDISDTESMDFQRELVDAGIVKEVMDWTPELYFTKGDRARFVERRKILESIDHRLNLIILQSNGHTRIKGLKEFLYRSNQGAYIMSPSVNYPRQKAYKLICFPFFGIDSRKLEEYRNYYNRWGLAIQHILHIDESIRSDFVAEVCRDFLSDDRKPWLKAATLMNPAKWTFLGTVGEEYKGDWF